MFVGVCVGASVFCGGRGVCAFKTCKVIITIKKKNKKKQKKNINASIVDLTIKSISALMKD